LTYIDIMKMYLQTDNEVSRSRFSEVEAQTGHTDTQSDTDTQTHTDSSDRTHDHRNSDDDNMK